MKTAEFKLTGLTKPRSANIRHFHTDIETVKAVVDMPKDRFDALFDYCVNNWKEDKIAVVEYELLNDNGLPIGGIVKEIKTS